MLNEESKIIAVTVCVNYDDFLSLIIENNIQFLKDWYIVTDESDTNTQALCEQFGLKCILASNWFNEETMTLDKARYLNLGLEQAFLNRDEEDWVLILDSDIHLDRSVMTNLNKKISTKRLRKNSMYSVPRIFVDHKETFDLMVENNFAKGVTALLLEKKEIYIRKLESFGAGYFQLFHKEAYYDEEALNDWTLEYREHMHQFIRDNFEFLPDNFEFPEYDLADIKFTKGFESVESFPGHLIHIGESWVNWSGRTTDRW